MVCPSHQIGRPFRCRRANGVGIGLLGNVVTGGRWFFSSAMDDATLNARSVFWRCYFLVTGWGA